MVKHTVDGWNLAPPGMYENPVNNGIFTYICHIKWCRISSINSSTYLWRLFWQKYDTMQKVRSDFPRIRQDKELQKAWCDGELEGLKGVVKKQRFS